MTYNVFGGTLNPAQSIHTALPAIQQRWHSSLYPQPIKAGTRFSNPRGTIQVGLAWLHTAVVYPPEDGLPSQY